MLFGRPIKERLSDIFDWMTIRCNERSIDSFRSSSLYFVCGDEMYSPFVGHSRACCMHANDRIWSWNVQVSATAYQISADGTDYSFWNEKKFIKSLSIISFFVFRTTSRTSRIMHHNSLFSTNCLYSNHFYLSERENKKI